MPESKITFAPRNASAFVTDVKKEVNEYFKSRGISKQANGLMILKTALILSLAVGAYLLIILQAFGLWATLGLCAVLGAGLAGMGFCVAHDALHGAYSSKPWVNKLLGYSFDFMGANGYMWKITHNVIHHTYTNIPGIDEDLTVSPLIRLSPEARRYWFHRYQHWFALPAYSLATINWLFMKDFQQFLKSDIGPYTSKKHPPFEIFTLIWTKLFVISYQIVIPLLVMNVVWWQFIIGFVVMHMTAGVVLGLIFQLAHVVEGPEYLGPDEGGNMEHSWIIHEMHTTANFARQNKILSWYVGGLNFQIEHHLFPQVCSIHYPDISPIVKQVAHRHNVPYHDHPTLRASIASHFKMLRMLGARDPVEMAT
ncbi:MAG: acyl-CoA desaturase [Bacteroidetes bacterium]|nr:MAG: acyl-CoA desaturase [Bacteroidota bacterium]